MHKTLHSMGVELMKKTWLYSLCLFLLAVGCSRINSNTSAVEKNSRKDLLKEQFIELKAEAVTGRLHKQIEQISHVAKGRVSCCAFLMHNSKEKGRGKKEEGTKVTAIN